MSDQSQDVKKASSKKGLLKYALYIFIVLAATAISLFSSLYGQFDAVMEAISSSNWRWVLAFIGIELLTYVLAGLIIKIFVRLYTKKYMLYRGIAVAAIGDFYSNVTPSASGGQIMQVYTLKKQGVQVSNAASIMVMWFILYQVALILVGVLSLIFKWDFILKMDPITILGLSIPMLPVIFVGFALNALIILLLFTMSYSHRVHNFILRYGIGFLGKIKLVRNPDKTRENLRVQVENFKIELRRLQSNIPVTVLITILFIVFIFVRNSMPYFSFLSVVSGRNDLYSAYYFDFIDWLDAGLLGSLHQMCAGIIPLPGLAGVSEYFYNVIYSDFLAYTILYPTYTKESLPLTDPTTTPAILVSSLLNASQILWRTVTFHAVTLITGIVSAVYHPRNHDEAIQAPNRQTFVDLQLATFDERKKTSDLMYQTKTMSRKNLNKKKAVIDTGTVEIEKRTDYQPPTNEDLQNLLNSVEIENGKKEKPKKVKEKKQKADKPKKPKKDKSKSNDLDDDNWSELII